MWRWWWWRRCSTGTVAECVLLPKNVFSYYRMCSLTIVASLFPRAFPVEEFVDVEGIEQARSLDTTNGQKREVCVSVYVYACVYIWVYVCLCLCLCLCLCVLYTHTHMYIYL